MLYLAPLQGFTDVFYRSAFVKIIGGIDKYYTSFFEINNNKTIVAPNKWELSTLLNIDQKLVPQIVAKDFSELRLGAEYFIEQGFAEMNLNLGCPFPMLVKRQKGCGALPFPQETASMLEAFYAQNLPIELSIKTRLGLNESSELPALLSRINHLPIKELIVHFRLGSDQYKGEVRWNEMEAIQAATSFKIVGNGDINSIEDLTKLQNKFPSIEDWMIGRGLLINPLLAQEIKGAKFSNMERAQKCKKLHQQLIDDLLQEEIDQNRYLNSGKAFWHYHSQYYKDGRKMNKEINKTKNITNYNSAVKEIWNTIMRESME